MDNWHEKKLPFQGIEPRTSRYLKIERSQVRIPPGDSVRQFYIIILQPFEEYHFPYMEMGLCRKLLRMTHTTSQKIGSEADFWLCPWHYSNLVTNVAFSFARKALHRFLAASFASNCAPTRARPNATGAMYIAMLVFRLTLWNP